MYSFHYQKALSLEQATAALVSSEASRILSGGMTLIPSLKHRLIQVDELIDITGLPGLSDIRLEDKHVWIGAGATHQNVSRDPQVRQCSVGLAELAGMIGDPQVRARGTIGGSVANNDRLPCRGSGTERHHRDPETRNSSRCVFLGHVFHGTGK